MGITMKCYGGAPGNRGASLFPEGRTYSPPRRRKVRFPPFLPDGENCGRSLAPPLPTKPAALRGPLLGGGIPPAGRARALSEGDCVSCGSRRTMPQPGWFCCHRPRSYRKHTRFCICEQGYSLYPCLAPTACENLPPAALSQIWVSLLRRHPFSFCKKETKTKGR